MQDIIRNQSASFTDQWDNLTIKQRNFLVAAVSKRPSSFFSNEFITDSNLGSASNIQRVVKSLIQKRILEKENANIFVEDVFFAEWIRGTSKNPRSW